jgi:hypothetical protein
MRLDGPIILATLTSLAASGDGYTICDENTDVTRIVTEQGPVRLYAFTMHGCRRPLESWKSGLGVGAFARCGAAP